MATNVFTPIRLFTVDDANASLPLVRAITRDLVRVSADLLDRRERLHALLSGRKLKSGDLYDDELTLMEDELKRDAGLIESYINELVELGIETKSAVDGVLDFPSMLNGCQACLCWKLGEETVAYWHEPHTPYETRRLIADPSGTETLVKSAKESLA